MELRWAISERRHRACGVAPVADHVDEPGIGQDLGQLPGRRHRPGRLLEPAPGAGRNGDYAVAGTRTASRQGSGRDRGPGVRGRRAGRVEAQLLEFRHIDGRLDRNLSEAYRLVHPAAHSYVPFWRTHHQNSAPGRTEDRRQRRVRAYGQRAEAVGRPVPGTGLPHAGRALHLDSWERSIERSLATIQGVYQVISDQAASFRAEFLEWIIIVLIAVEIVLGLLKR